MSLSTDGASGTCPHIASSSLERVTLSAKFGAIASRNVQCTFGGTRPSKRRKLAAPVCGTCDIFLARPFACLQCSYSGCWRDGHVRRHLEESGHMFCIDIKTGCIFCSECGDFVYDSSINHLFSRATIAQEEKHTEFRDNITYREPFSQWLPNDKETALLEAATTVPCQGRRGLLNLGQTCFMNAILQSFVVNPLLRNHFLSDKHNHLVCKNDVCTCCELDKLFIEVFSDNSTPYGPTSFLATTWRASSELSGYAQQDAHEFFISALNQIHAKSHGSTTTQCNCVVHSTFAGQLQSNVECERCGNITTATDPMFDISLDLRDKGGGQDREEMTLASCLRRFTHPERLGSNEYSCAKCGKASHEVNKRLSIRKLPPVLSFQFKRFEHKSGDKTAAHKIEAPIRFPSTINMAPFTTLGMDLQDREAKSGGMSDSTLFPMLSGPRAMYEYDLFSVVCHEGQINNGHYTCFARSQDEWYRFDDDRVTHSSLGACLDSRTQAYMCFYVKRHLDYKPYVTPAYKVMREAEAVKEREREREREKAARMRDLEVENELLATV